MSNSQYILQEYADLRNHFKNELEEKKQALYTQFPRLKEIESEMVKLSVELSRAILNDALQRDSLLLTLKNKQMDLKIERAELLASNKYPIDYLDMKYQCKNCKDTGFIDGKKCSCYTKREIGLNYKQSNLKESINKENFDNFNFEYYSNEKRGNELSPKANMKNIFSKCIQYVKNFDNHSTNLFFIGKPGLGKTFLCNAIATDLLDSGKSVIYQTSADLIDMIRKYKFDFEKEDSHQAQLEEIYQCDLLIIDDLGIELMTQFSGLAIYNILNRRIVNNKKMIISTNLDIDDIMKIYSDRITSRIIGNFDICEFFGEDIRIKMHNII